MEILLRQLSDGLPDLVDFLAQNGEFDLGVDQVLAIEFLLTTLHAGNPARSYSAEQISAFIAPIACRNQQEQLVFHSRFTRWIARDIKTHDLPVQSVAPASGIQQMIYGAIPTIAGSVLVAAIIGLAYFLVASGPLWVTISIFLLLLAAGIPKLYTSVSDKLNLKRATIASPESVLRSFFRRAVRLVSNEIPDVSLCNLLGGGGRLNRKTLILMQQLKHM